MNPGRFTDSGHPPLAGGPVLTVKAVESAYILDVGRFDGQAMTMIQEKSTRHSKTI